eukprot:scaffold918_cov126-Cylindrotheca_fusiformis.AAC.59
MQTAAQSTVETNHSGVSNLAPGAEESKHPTNLSQAKIGTASCWGTLKTLQDTILDSTKRKSDLSSNVGGPRTGLASVWDKISGFAREVVPVTSDDGEPSRYSETKKKPNDTSSSVINAERLKAMAASAVKPRDMTEEGEDANNEELVVEPLDDGGDVI